MAVISTTLIVRLQIEVNGQISSGDYWKDVNLPFLPRRGDNFGIASHSFSVDSSEYDLDDHKAIVDLVGECFTDVGDVQSVVRDLLDKFWVLNCGDALFQHDAKQLFDMQSV